MSSLDMKNRQHLLLVITAALVGFFLADKVIIGPLTDLWKQRANKIVALRKQVEEGQQLTRRRMALQERWDYMRTNTLPNNPSLAEQRVFNAFDRWAQGSRVSITSISPQWKHDADDYITLECRVEATGNLGTLTRFLYEIEKDPIALKLENMEISARDADGQQLALGLQLSGLVLTPTETKQ